ncbi:zinc-binding dehydrogenase [Rugosimonospora acidiphila]|uniref:Zinc-binding dehydrogenase n=1 Tax=Rugosimonospora acidiphila TaxID=556531 RepID=A0ABP9S794_9ACTN
MKAVRYLSHGGPDVLRVEEIPAPEAGHGQVLIAVEAVGANAIDTVFRRGGGAWARPLPGRLTGDVVGRVTALGPGVEGVRVGDRVAALSEDAFAEVVAADAQWLAPVPAGLDAATATVLPMTAPLALRLLKVGRLAAGETVLIQSAAGGVGHLAVQLARRLGAGTVVGTASGPRKREFVRSLGADATADSGDPSWPEAVRSAAPHGVDVVLDSVGGGVFDAGLALLAPLGRMVTYGAITGEVPTVAAHGLFALKSVTGMSTLAWRAARPAEARADLTEAARLLADGVLRPATHATLPLAEVARAHEILDARGNLGRVVITMP